MAYGALKMRRVGASLLDLISLVSPTSCIRSNFPLSFEEMNHPFGYVVYTATVPAGQNLSVPGIRDHGYVLLDGHYKVR
jgi:hypothetical protein